VDKTAPSPDDHPGEDESRIGDDIDFGARREVAPASGSARTLAGARLPVALTSLVGREGNLATVLAMLARDDVRFVTLAGPGGVGKTRLAVEIARRAGDLSLDAWFVPLAPIDDPEMVAPTIAAAVGAPRHPGMGAVQRLVAHFRDSPTLLVLDNVEQVIDIADLLTTLLSSCPGLKLLVTSRFVLRVSAEHVYSVPTLRLPDIASLNALPAAQESDAIRLFVDRARNRRPEFELTESNAAVVTAICRRLDGLPLGIELAAARISAISPRELLDRLDARLSLLADGARDEPGRLRSLRESIIWSHDLLSPEEKVVFRRLGVFAGPWTLDAAESVLHGDAEELAIFDVLASLIDKSLLRQVVQPDGESHYAMLATIRGFAAERLDASNDAVPLRLRLCAWLADIARESFFAFYLPDGAKVQATLDMYAADLARCHAWLETRPEVDLQLSLARSLAMFWSRNGGGNGEATLTQAIARGRRTHSPELGRTLISMALLLHMRGDEQSAWSAIQEGISLVTAEGDVAHRFVALTYCGLIAQRNDAVFEAETYQTAALAMLPTLPDAPWLPFAESTVLGHLGNNAITQGNIAKAKAYFARAIAIQTERGYAPGTSHYSASHPIAGLGDVARGENNPATALTRYQHALRLASLADDYRATVYAIGGVAAALATAGDWERAARLFGATEELHERGGIHFGMETLDRQRGLGLPEPWLRSGESFGSAQHIHDALWDDRDVPFPPIPDTARADELWRAGRGMSLVDATAEALAATLGPSPTSAQNSLEHSLSPREIEVLRLLVDGATDAEIAAALFISRRTVATHVAHIYAKLGVSSRATAAAWAIRNGIA
jgi:non-specific serine/threonine protein kinase